MFPRVRLRFLVTVLSLLTLTILLYCYELGGTDSSTGIRAMPEGSMLQQELSSFKAGSAPKIIPESSRTFKPGNPLPPDYAYTKTIVMPKRKSEDTSWLDEELPSIPKAIYVVDDPHAPLHPPANKGNEAMAYLSYIIDHYTNLSDISIFIHAHRWAWHNNDLLDNDSAMVIKHLLPNRVAIQGYVNLRCQWYPGCPAWLSPHTTTPNDEKREELQVKHAWSQLFPGDALPPTLAQPCCSQFALSRDRIHAVPRAEYVRLRQWLLDSRLDASTTGRLFEYLWQYLWTGAAVVCPSQHACYCDNFGVCFASEADFQAWFELRFYLRRDEWEWLGGELASGARDEWLRLGRARDAKGVNVPSKGRMDELKHAVDDRWIVLLNKRDAALRDGRDPRLRARIAGRKLDESDTLLDI